jgi:hypothetical protein
VEQTLKQISEHIFARGKHDTLYVRRRIPAAIRAAYPPKKECVTRSLRTTDLREAKRRATAALALIDAEFQAHREKLDLARSSMYAKRIGKLDDAQLEGIARHWVHQVLTSDEHRRQEGMDDEEFEELGSQLTGQRAELGRMLAQGKSLDVLPALHGFLHLCGLDFDPSHDEAKRACYAFLRAAVRTLDHQLARQRGDMVDTNAVAPESTHPLQAVFPERAPPDRKAPNWERVFETWRDYVENRPKSTMIASQTPWRDLPHFAEGKGVRLPGAVTPELMTEFMGYQQERGLKVKTMNERLRKIKAIYAIAVGKLLLKINPAKDTLGFKENGVKKRRKRRLPFDAQDLKVIFGSEVYTQHRRSRGRSGEATYWIPVMMFYTGARPEEIAGLALKDLRRHPELG